MAQILVLLCLLSFIAVGFCKPLGCPHTEDLFPCSCKRFAVGLRVVCADFNTSNHLTRAFRILRDYRVHTVLLHALYINETLPNDLFDGLQINEIKVEKSKLRFPQPAFTGLDSSLYVLNVAEKSLIKSQERFALAKLSKLHELYVQSNKLEKVEDKWLNEKVPNVETLVLDSNDISELEEHAFANLASLKKISLSDNRIKIVKRSMFPDPAPYLIRIDLSFNEIHSLPENFFTNMETLRDIVLSGNELKTLPMNTWIGVWRKLSTVLLFDNPLDCDEKIEWMKKYPKPYNLDGNCVLPKSMSGRSIRTIFNT
ncbi:hypothetical protein CDAR_529841 [Caerostris darwini]|uniref:Uncharacterized protein n=1 Tax=Caerostris darwini TaxID=1538125 RepID=A0AAV4SER7_9ARAC|nr:hypothetical protein CDAR_529841 [Caerostris darwini]